jgi:hypothetical protein
MKISYINFTQDVISAALDAITESPALILFPTRRSKLEGIKRYQSRWNFTPHCFLTMDEWKEHLFCPSAPILREEKRTLTLYRSLSPQSLEFFHITDYFSSITTAHQFFGFWEELVEEGVALDAVEEILQQKQTAGDWQLSTLYQLCAMRDGYENALNEIGYSDRIFTTTHQGAPTCPFQQIIVVNQFYFTKRERTLLEYFSDNVQLIVQAPESAFDAEALQIKPDFDASCLHNATRGSITVINSAESWEMLARLAQQNPEQQPVLIDFKPHRQPYTGLLASHRIASDVPVTFASTALYRLLSSLHDVHSSRVHEGQPFLLSVPQLTQLYCDTAAITALCDISQQPSSADESTDTTSQQTRDWLFDAIQRGYQFIDAEALRHCTEPVRTSLERIFALIAALDDVSDCQALAAWLRHDVQADELLKCDSQRTDIYTQFYASLADFITIEESGIIANWRGVFPQYTGSNLLRLFLDYLKPKTLRHQFNNQLGNRMQSTSLQDTRNLQFDTVYVLNLVEGVLPAARQQQFLLSEQQRSELGLKTYAHIRLRDKYYFFRLIASARQALLFTRSNLEQDVEMSSFVEELLLHGVAEIAPSPPLASVHGNAFKALLGNRLNTAFAPRVMGDDFFAFRFDTADFTEGILPLSATSWQRLATDPFSYFIEYIGGCRQREPRLETDFSARLIGIISHSVLDGIWKRLFELYQGNEMHHNFLHTAENYAQRGIENYLKFNKHFRYYSPHNYSDIYFRHIFLNLLQRGVQGFFYQLHHTLQLSDRPLSVLAEKAADQQFFFVMPQGIAVHLHGRPDLHIRTKDGQSYILDYKTGSADASRLKKYDQQLQFYMLIEYPQATDPANPAGYLWFIEQQILHKMSRENTISDNINEVWQRLVQEGFALAPRPAPYELPTITRRDLQGGRQ